MGVCTDKGDHRCSENSPSRSGYLVRPGSRWVIAMGRFCMGMHRILI